MKRRHFTGYRLYALPRTRSARRRMARHWYSAGLRYGITRLCAARGCLFIDSRIVYLEG